MSAAKQKTVGSDLVKFNFHGDELDVVPGHGEAHVVVRRVCDAIGVTYKSQIDKLKTDPAMRAGLRMILTPSSGGAQETACLEIRRLPLWLATIHPSKVKPEIRNKLVEYKLECADVLADHFLGKRNVAPANDAAWEMLAALHMRLESMERRLAEAAQAPGILSRDQVRWISDRVRVLAEHRRRLGYNISDRSARKWIDERIKSAAEWGGKAQTRANMPADRYSRVDVLLTQLEDDLAAEERRRGVERRGGREAVRIMKDAVARSQQYDNGLGNVTPITSKREA